MTDCAAWLACWLAVWRIYHLRYSCATPYFLAEFFLLSGLCNANNQCRPQAARVNSSSPQSPGPLIP